MSTRRDHRSAIPLSLLGWVLLVAAPCLPALEFPLADRCYSEAVELAAGWSFAWDRNDSGVEEGWQMPDHDRSEWTAIDLPRVWDQEPGEVAIPVRRGVGWFARDIEIPAAWDGSVLLHFLGAQFACDVWVEGEWVGSQTGGFAPFAIDISSACKPGDRASVLVRIDNRLGTETVPGNNIGWEPYGGITREVYLCHRPPAWLDGFATRFDQEQPDGPGRLQVTARAAGAIGRIRAELRAGGTTLGAKEALVAAGEAIDLSIEVTAPRLWSPDDPFLHHLLLEWDQGEVEIPLALRTIGVQGRDVLLNGRPIWLQGFGIHEHWAGFGPCVPHHEREAELRYLKQAYGLTCLRPGHYPNHPEFYRQCDRIGLLVFTEIPAWQIKADFLGSDQAWSQWLRPQIDAMIDTYRNFGSIVAWGVGNENACVDAYYRRSVAHIEARDPSRLTTIVLAATSCLGTYDLVDVGARNFHYGWYHSKNVYALREGLAKNRRAAGEKPIWIAEQGAHAVRDRIDGAYNSLARGGEVYQDHVVRFGFQYLATASERVAGISPWSWADFQWHGREFPHGLTDSRRRPKAVAYTLRNLMAPGERIFAVESTTHCEPGGRLEVALHAFSPRPLTGKRFSFRWSIRRAGQEFASGDGEFTRDDQRSQKIGTLTWNIPQEASGHHDLWVELLDDEGTWLRSNALPFGVGETETPGLLVVPPNGEDGWLEIDGWRFPIHPRLGLRMFASPGSVQGEVHQGGRVRPVSAGLASGQIVDLAAP